MKRKVTTAPTSSPVTLAEVKTQLVIEFSDDDALLTDQIDRATDWAEHYLNRPIMSQVITYYFDSFPGVVKLQTTDISSVVVTYDDSDNAEQTLAGANYYLDAVATPSELTVVDSWPDTYDKPNAVRVAVTAGHATAATVPKSIKAGILMLVGHMYENREGSSDRRVNSVPMGVESFLNTERVHP